jgi:hypothetical protein
MRNICFALFFCFLVPLVANAGVSVVGSLTHQKKANPGPGDIYEGSIVVKNTSSEPREVRIYQTDYEFYFNGTNNYGPPGKLKRSNADWISFNPHWLTVPPDGTSTVHYTVKVPDEPNLVGTYWSMLMVEGVPESSLQSGQLEKGKAKVGITQVFRYGIQMITHIGDTGERKLKFLETKLVKEAGRRTFHVDVENTGQRWLRPLLWLELYDETGAYIGKFEGGTKRIYPDTSVRYKIDLTNVPNDNYKALMVADCGEDYIFGANYTLKLEK